MSHKERYGTLVWDALSKAFNHPDTRDDQWIGVGEIASTAGISKATAQKYLDALCKMGHAKSVSMGYGRNIVKAYRPQWGDAQ